MDIKKIKAQIIRLLMLNSTPHGIALGVAIGVFIVITPTYGLHTLMVITAAFLIPRANKMAMLLGTMVSFPLTLPFITWGGYEIGRFVLRGRGYPDLNEVFFRELSRLSLWGMVKAIKDLYAPLFIGSVILGLICGLFFYIIVFLLTFSLKSVKNQSTMIKGKN